MDLKCYHCGKLFDYTTLIVGMCPGCYQETQAERDRQAMVRRLEAGLKEWRRICPPLYQQTEVDRLPPGSREILNWQYGPKGLYIVGPTRTCKTRSAWMLIQRLLCEGRKVKFFDAMSFGHECQTAFMENTGEEWALKAAQIEIVFMDDFGKSRFTDRVASELFGLIERRVANLLPIIVTSNLFSRDIKAEDKKETWGDPMVRRLREFCHIIKMQ